MGYTPLFDTLTKGTLCGRWPDIGLWPVVLSLADRHGVVDCTPAFIAGVTGLPVDDVIACMKRFCGPDQYSRSPVCGGARLELIDAHREWGWRVVNFDHYREKSRKAAYDAERVASGKDAERKRVERSGASRDVPTRPDASRALPLSDSDSDKDTKRGSHEPSVSKVLQAGEAAPPKARRTSRVPEDFLPDLSYARAHLPDLDVEREVQKFRDWEFKTPRSDWAACWRNWIGNCRDSGKYARASTNGSDRGLPRLSVV